MKLRLESDPGRTAIVRLHGELDIAGCDEFERELESVQKQGARTVIVDLSDLEFLDSSGLRSLLKSHAQMQDSGVRLAVVRGNPGVHRVFQITRTDERLDFVDDIAEVATDGDGAG